MSGGGEREFTARLAEWFGRSDRVPVGIGDDAAVVDNTNAQTVVACDPVVEGRHFTRGTDPRAIGRKAVLRNLSDLAAMGARPDFAIASVLLPADFCANDRDALFDGLRSATREFGCQVVGGDTGATAGPLTITVTVLGHLVAAPLLRSGARIGDAIHVSGPLGGAVTSGRHLEPSPRIEFGAWLAECGAATAAIDVSDGLLLDLRTMLDASGCRGAEIDVDALPVHPDLRGDPTAVTRACSDGEDYELLFCRDASAAWPDGCPGGEIPRRPIGRVVDAAGLWLVRVDGTRVEVQPEGYQHHV